ncbi:Eukaryotic translation elongation factor 1 epsilon-1 [Operophtera brumata]|uniref:Eukaryotic translation elongation factor 1 epsilon-1 n=1 Tax=Operophtera brumata TaxID=104452 RepID=A0A0L7LMN7_OPEBR|nr:Eukaryotic translation elongation factor 1 epsilon-1 [Operophtera brumata]
MSACNVDVIKLVGKYYNAPVGTVCYNTDRVLTTVVDKQNIEGFASIVLKLAAKTELSQEQLLLCYQWLEHIAMYANQAASNTAFAKAFLEERISVLEKESIIHVCRWFRHMQAQPRVCSSRPPLPLDTLSLSFLAPVPH